MKDFFDQELNVGDVVAFEEPSYRNLSLGTIVAFTPKQVRLAWVKDGRTYNYLTYASHLIKRPVMSDSGYFADDANDDASS